MQDPFLPVKMAVAIELRGHFEEIQKRKQAVTVCIRGCFSTLALRLEDSYTTFLQSAANALTDCFSDS